MDFPRIFRAGLGIGLIGSLAACGMFSHGALTPVETTPTGGQAEFRGGPASKPQGKLGDLFSKSTDPNTSVRVNKYIWNAALDVLSFLPIESVDPFTGVIVTGYGTPPGGGRAYRATIYVQDPALDARSLNIAMESRGGGPVSVETVRAIEDAILTRAREMRIKDGRL